MPRSNCGPHEVLYVVQTKIYTLMFITIIFFDVKTWKWLRYPSVGEWTNKLCFFHTWNIIQWEEQISCQRTRTTWRKFKCILVSERSQTENCTYYIISILYNFNYIITDTSKKTKTMEVLKKKISGCQGLGEGKN
jgi:hypothetical protein